MLVESDWVTIIPTFAEEGSRNGSPSGYRKSVCFRLTREVSLVHGTDRVALPSVVTVGSHQRHSASDWFDSSVEHVPLEASKQGRANGLEAYHLLERDNFNFSLKWSKALGLSDPQELRSRTGVDSVVG